MGLFGIRVPYPFELFRLTNAKRLANVAKEKHNDEGFRRGLERKGKKVNSVEPTATTIPTITMTPTMKLERERVKRKAFGV